VAWFLITEAVSSWVKYCLAVAETLVKGFYLRTTHVKYLNWSDAWQDVQANKTILDMPIRTQRA